MRRKLVGAAVLLFLASVANAQRKGAVDWIFLVDTSKSMRGVGGTRDIFDDVKASIGTFVREANDGDSVAVYTFDRDVQLHSATNIGGAARDDLQTIVGGLKANGDRTHLGLAIRQGLERAASLRPDATRTRAVVLFTDGKEDVRGIRDPVRIASNVDRVGDSYVFFVSMGDEHEAQLDDFARVAKNTTVMRAPSANAIREVAEKIRSTLPADPPPPSPRPEPMPPVVEKTSSLRWLILLPILAAIGFFAWSQHRKNNQLEGELEILQPRIDSAFVGLPRLAASEVTLSSILPIDALGGSDARLFVRRHDGSKSVWISARSGALRVNEVETPESELFDADTIQLGDAKLRFNRAGHERPQEDL
jgi:Mg-chelatase subunit ChlD